MAHNPIPTIVFILASRVLVGLVVATSVDLDEIEPCSSIGDVLTGCGGTVGAILGTAFGIIPGAHPLFNLLVAVVSNFALVWSILTWARGT